MSKKIIVRIILFLCIAVFAYGAIALFLHNKEPQSPDYFPPQPTQEEFDAIRDLPREECPCWDGIDNICLPEQACV